MSHMQNLSRLVMQWLELELPETCVSLDTYTSMKIQRHKEDVVTFTKKARGMILVVARAKVSVEQSTVAWDTDPHLFTPDMGLVLYSLDKALETH